METLPLSKSARIVSNIFGKVPLREADPHLWNLLNAEKRRQSSCLEMVASENFTGRAVMECVASCLTNKYTEGYPNTRLPRGTHIIDQVERLSQSRLLDVFKLKTPDQNMEHASWGVNVQPLSGSPSNFAVFTALLKPHDRIMGLNVVCGGHPTHGYLTPERKLSATSIYFESMPYKLDRQTERIDYDALEKSAELFMPKMIIAGVCTHPRLLDYARFRQVCDKVGAILLADMAHISGLVAAGVVPSPFEFADLVTSTTHKTLRGPRSGMIFYRKHSRKNDVHEHRRPVATPNYEPLINEAVFPGMQSGPHENVIAGMACMAREASQPEFVDYANQVLVNAQTLAEGLTSRGVRLVSNGTDVHFVVVDLSSSPGHPRLGLGDAARVQVVADACGLTFSSVPVPRDVDYRNASGLRIGTPALTTRGFQEEDFEKVTALIDEVLYITEETKLISCDWDNLQQVLQISPEITSRINNVREVVAEFASNFPMPGFEEF